MSRKAKMIEHNGMSLSVREWAKWAGMPVSTLTSRISAGWSIEDALEKPTLPRGNGAKKVVSSEDSGALMSGQDVVKFILACDSFTADKKVSLLRQLLDDDGQR
jgi:hypothetical protein